MLSKMTNINEMQRYERVCDILATLHLKGVLRQRELEMAVDVYYSTVKKSMKYCVKMGLVVVHQEKTGRREITYRLTPKGDELAMKIIEVEHLLSR